MDSALICWRRRRLLGVAAATLVGSWGGLSLRSAWAGEDTESAAAQALITEFLAGLSPQDEGIRLTLPEVADNATSVPLQVAVDFPADGSVFCEEILVVAEANPYPTVCRFKFTSLMGRAQVETRIRLAESQQVLALARMSDGSIRQAQREIMVTLGGCS